MFTSQPSLGRATYGRYLDGWEHCLWVLCQWGQSSWSKLPRSEDPDDKHKDGAVHDDEDADHHGLDLSCSGVLPRVGGLYSAVGGPGGLGGPGCPV